MNSAWYHKTTGQLIPRATYNCGGIQCRRCGPERVERYLTRLPEIWPDDRTYYLAEPFGRNWRSNFDFVARSLRKEGISLDYLVARRDDVCSGSRRAFIWASMEVTDFADTQAGWKSYGFSEAVIELRNQLCLPGPSASFFPPKGSLSWTITNPRRTGGLIKGWDRCVVDMAAYSADYESAARDWERRCGVHPSSDKALPDPDAWLKHLTDLRIVVGQ